MHISNSYSSSASAGLYSSASKNTQTGASTGVVENNTRLNAENSKHSSSFSALLATQMGADNTASRSVSAPGAVAATGGKSSIELEEIDMNNLLTDDDKRLTGWPGAQPNWAAIYIALDRKDGSLQGPVTEDYLVGNLKQNIVGLAERSQGEAGITSEMVDQMLERLAG